MFYLIIKFEYLHAYLVTKKNTILHFYIQSTHHKRSVPLKDLFLSHLASDCIIFLYSEYKKSGVSDVKYKLK